LVNTRRLSRHWLPARSRSAFWLAQCLRIIATTPALSGTGRRERSVFGSLITRRSAMRPSVAATLNMPAL
jgi:hypothetical protein